MAAIDFPNSPVLDQTFTANNRTWKWDGVSWNVQEVQVLLGPTGPANTLTVGTVSSTGPENPPQVTITGTSPNQTLNFVLPQGSVGPTGPSGLPTQTGNTGKYLTTDGTATSWSFPLPDQTGNSGKHLVTNGTVASWSNTITSTTAGTQAIIAKAAASQTANIQEWQDSSSTPLAYITAAGKLVATSKSFEIDHPTKPDMKLRYGSLEGPENGVYVRGRIINDVISLPDYWPALVDEQTITVNLTPVGRPQNLYVERIANNKVYIAGGTDINVYYTVFAERKDIAKLTVEY